jgi:hypothetical protein
VLSMVTQEHLLEIFRRKYEENEPAGWCPARTKFGYFNPDDTYDATVDSLVAPGTAWLDVGCGRDLPFQLYNDEGTRRIDANFSGAGPGSESWMREIRTSISMRGHWKRATTQRACALLYRSPWLLIRGIYRKCG